MAAPMPSTIWSEIRRARDIRGTALDELLTQYWKPIIDYLKKRGFSNEDAEDITQEVLAQISQDEFLQKADSDRGRFRSLLFSVTQHLASMRHRKQNTKKRGGSFERIPLDQLPPAKADEMEEYNRLWATHLVELTLDQMRRSHPEFATVIDLHYLKGIPQKNIAETLGKSEQDIKNAAFRGRNKFKEFLPQIIHAYCSSPEEAREELRELSRHLPS